MVFVVHGKILGEFAFTEDDVDVINSAIKKGLITQEIADNYMANLTANDSDQLDLFHTYQSERTKTLEIIDQINRLKSQIRYMDDKKSQLNASIKRINQIFSSIEKTPSSRYTIKRGSRYTLDFSEYVTQCIKDCTRFAQAMCEAKILVDIDLKKRHIDEYDIDEWDIVFNDDEFKATIKISYDKYEYLRYSCANDMIDAVVKESKIPSDYDAFNNDEVISALYENLNSMKSSIDYADEMISQYNSEIEKLEKLKGKTINND